MPYLKYKAVLFSVLMAAHLLSIDDLEPLLHLATLCAPALLVSDQRNVGMVGDAVVARAAVNTLSIVIITQVIIATTETKCLVISSIKGMRRVTKLFTVSVNIPLCEFQVRCVVDHSSRFPIQTLPFQTETMKEKPQK